MFQKMFDEAGALCFGSLSGVSTRETCEEYPYRPKFILKGVGEIPGK